MSDPEYGIGADGNARGLLIYAAMGMGKTRLAVAVAMVLVMKKKSPDYEEVLSVAVVAAVVFGILDTLAPSVGGSARAGAGFGLGANMVGFPRMG